MINFLFTCHAEVYETSVVVDRFIGKEELQELIKLEENYLANISKKGLSQKNQNIPQNAQDIPIIDVFTETNKAFKATQQVIVNVQNKAIPILVFEGGMAVEQSSFENLTNIWFS